MGKSGISVRVGGLPGVRRLPLYVRLLREMARQGQEVVSAVALANAAGVVTAVVKKDIEMTGAAGKTGVGYEVTALIRHIETFLGWDRPTRAVLVGAGRLGSALLGYGGLRERGLGFAAAFDTDKRKIGHAIHDVPVMAVERIGAFLARNPVDLAVMTVPSGVAQDMADRLVEAGITRIWTFASAVLAVPPGVTVQREDLSSGLAELMVRSRAGAE